ncbi:hypothetical protein KUTeg_017196 [Tegillarca granosa]|uniref:Wntless-like transmembrane domain-containing protein n=1 Tax=Tegillarca granosa TaxID=220873 RepID=A0ABQ9EN26_TEGGR|nr:hypothetical protein KUTeg_017196 [Tegillarca granosa]
MILKFQLTIHQNGGFTIVWFSMKTVMFPMVLTVLIWFWRRIKLLSRSPNLLERTLFALGITMTFLNFPMEWLTLWIDIPFMLLMNDIRQGIFYAMLLCFWIIFAGEHIMDQVERNRLVMYWKHLAAVIFGCVCLFVFEMCERGIQLRNPFFSIWVTETGKNLALAFIILAGIAACVYFLFLCYMVFCVFRNISAKKSTLPNMSSLRRKFYMVCVYGMWNVYIFGLLSLYAPSHKKYESKDDNDSNEEEVQLTQVPSETSALQPTATTSSALQAFVSKTAED